MTSNVLFQRGKHGSRERLIRNLYAYRVAAVMAGVEGICPTCGDALILDNNAEVDRTCKRDNYVTGEIVYLCGTCNQSRANVEWSRVDDYRADVARASESVEIPTAREAREWWNARPVPVRSVSRYA